MDHQCHVYGSESGNGDRFGLLNYSLFVVIIHQLASNTIDDVHTNPHTHTLTTKQNKRNNEQQNTYRDEKEIVKKPSPFDTNTSMEEAETHHFTSLAECVLV